jgi:UPF0716 protein FxsA
MFFYLLLVFIGIPLIEIALFIQVGGAIGTAATIAIVIATAFLGAWMLRAQGISTAQRAQASLQRGEIPVEQAFDGMFLVFAGGLLLTPGFLTDAIGFSLFIPQVRAFLRQRVTAMAARRRSSFRVYGTSGMGGTGFADEDAMWQRRGPQRPANDSSSAGPGRHRGPGGKGGKDRPPVIDGDAVDIGEDGPPRDDSPWRS